MRTSIEIKVAHRAKLLELAARQRVLRLRGSLSRKNADYLRREAETLRKRWR